MPNLKKPKVYLLAATIAYLAAPVCAQEATTTTADNEDLQLKAIISKNHSTKHAKIASAWQRCYQNGMRQRFQGHLDAAEKDFLEAIKQLKKVNLKDERLLKSRIELAETFLQNNKARDAKDTFKLALQTAKDLGKRHSQYTARCISGMARAARMEGKYKSSEDQLKKALSLSSELAGENSIEVSKNLLELAELYKDQKLYDAAEPVYKLSLKKLDNAKNVPELTKSNFLDKTGLFFHEQGKMPEANKLFELSLILKDKYTTLYSPVDARKRGLVTYRCENGVPNAARVYTRGNEIEYLKVKDAIAVATLTPQVYANDWYLLKAEVTLQNQGKKAITACAEQPTLTIKQPKLKRLSPLDSDAISRELGRRGRRMYSRLLHSADLAYTVNSIGLGGVTTFGVNTFPRFGRVGVAGFRGAPGFGGVRPVGFRPVVGTGMWTSVGGWVNITPDWGARLRARNAAIASLNSAYSQGASVLRTKPSPMTLNPGEAATFQVFFPYKKFKKSTLRFLVGNAVLEFPFSSKSG